jgi:hypothetical protein
MLSGLWLENKHFLKIIGAADHRLNTDGVPPGKGQGGIRKQKWEKSVKKYPAKDTPEYRMRFEEK